jgi:hypothetical protein
MMSPGWSGIYQKEKEKPTNAKRFTTENVSKRGGDLFVSGAVG